jgi:hypothetical protein
MYIKINKSSTFRSNLHKLDLLLVAMK